MSEPLNELAAALAKAQAKITSPPKNREVEVRMDSGGKYKFRYTTLDALIDHVREPLTSNGLWFTQVMGTDGQGRATLTTTLMHSSGQRIDGTMPIPQADGKNKIQAFGSAVTYMKRYALAALLGLASDEDDDGNAHDGNEARDTAPPRQDKPSLRPAPTHHTDGTKSRLLRETTKPRMKPAEAKRAFDLKALQDELWSCQDGAEVAMFIATHQDKFDQWPVEWLEPFEDKIIAQENTIARFNQARDAAQ